MFTLPNHGLNVLQWTNILDFFAFKVLSLHKYKFYSPNLLFGSLQNISAPVGFIKKLRPLYYIKRPHSASYEPSYRSLRETFVK